MSNKLTSEELSDQALTHLKAGEFSEAADSLLGALDHSPDSAQTWFRLGEAYRLGNKLKRAENSFLKALQLNPQLTEPRFRLAMIYARSHRLAAALGLMNQVLKSAPKNLAAMSLASEFELALGNYEASIALRKRIFIQRPQDGGTALGIASAYLLSGNFEDGWRWYERRFLGRTPHYVHHEQLRAWAGENLDGKTILVTGEQGLGDLINFIRYLLELKTLYTCKLLFACSKKYRELFRGVEFIDQLLEEASEGVYADYSVALSSLPGVLGHSWGDLPASIDFLAANPASVDYWRARLEHSDSFKIGIAWQGNPNFGNDHNRSFPLRALWPLLTMKGFEFVVLQKGPGTEQIPALTSTFPFFDLGQTLDTDEVPFSDTRAILESLDLVISCDTSVAHIAGSRNTEIWLALTAHKPDWRWGTAEGYSHWYPHLKIYRQERMGDWEALFSRIAKDLVKASGKVTPRSPADFKLQENEESYTNFVRHGLMTSLKSGGNIYRSLVAYGEFAQESLTLLSALIPAGSTVLEVNAHIGEHTLGLARLVGPHGELSAYEQRQALFELLKSNISLNNLNNTICQKRALASANDSIDSLSLQSLSLIKITSDGKELDVIAGARHTIERCRPLIYLSDAARTSQNKLVEHLERQGYVFFVHRIALYPTKNFFNNPINIFGSQELVNILAMPSQSADLLEPYHGLERIE